MSETGDHKRDEDDVALAGEYALGLLAPDEAQAFEARLNHEPALRAIYVEWCEDLVELTADAPEAQPRPIVKARLLQRLFERDAEGGLRHRMKEFLWLIGGAVAASLIVFAVYMNEGGEPTHAAELISEDQSIVVAARWLPESQEMTISRSRGAPDDGRDWELWLIVGEAAPVSLGVLPRDADGRIAISDERAADVAGAVLAISDEPLGGSPTGQATGPIIAVAALQEI